MKALVAHVRLELALTARNGESLLLTMGIPLLVLVFFTTVDVLPFEGDAIDHLAPGVLALATLSTAFGNLAIATGFDRSHGVLRRLGSTPLGRSRLVAAKVVAAGVVLAVQAVLVVAVAVALGWEPKAGAGPAVIAVALATVAFVGAALAMAGALPAMVTLAAANGCFVMLLLLSGMVVPLEDLPDPLAAVSRALPSTALADALRAALSDGVAVPGRAWLVLGLWAVAAPLVAVRTFRWGPSGTG